MQLRAECARAWKVGERSRGGGGVSGEERRGLSPRKPRPAGSDKYTEGAACVLGLAPLGGERCQVKTAIQYNAVQCWGGGQRNAELGSHRRLVPAH